MIISTLFPVFLHILSPYNTTQHTHPYQTHFFFSSEFSVFFHTHTGTRMLALARTHTHTPAIDRYLARGLSKSVCVNTRKSRELCLKKAKCREKLWRMLVSISTGKSFVCGEVAKDESNHLVAGSLRSFPHFQEKANDWRTRARVLLDLFSNFKRARSSAHFRLTSRASDNSAWTILGKEKTDKEA